MTEDNDRFYEHLTRLVDGVDANIVLPQQFFTERYPGNPREYNLRYKVFRGAIREFFKFAGSTTKSGRKTYGKAELWINSRDRHWPYSFENLCDVFSFPPGRTRDRLFAKKKEQQEARYRRAVQELRHEEAEAQTHEGPQSVCDSGPLSEGWDDEGPARTEAGCAQQDAGIPH